MCSGVIGQWPDHLLHPFLLSYTFLSHVFKTHWAVAPTTLNMPTIYPYRVFTIFRCLGLIHKCFLLSLSCVYHFQVFRTHSTVLSFILIMCLPFSGAMDSCLQCFLLSLSCVFLSQVFRTHSAVAPATFNIPASPNPSRNTGPLQPRAPRVSFVSHISTSGRTWHTRERQSCPNCESKYGFL